MKTLVTRLTLFVLVLCASKTVLAANIWDGGGGDALWDTAGNWDDDVVPGVAAITIGTGFGSGLTIDLNGNRTITSLAINATGLYTIANDTLTLNSGTISRTGAGGTVTIGSDVALGANGAWNNSASASSQIQVDGIISDGGSGFGVTTTASSSSRGFTFNGANTFTGDLTVNTSSVNIGGDNSARTGQNIVNSGSLIVSHADALGSGKIVMNGGSLNLGFASDVTLSNPWAITSSTFGYTGSGGGSEFTMTGTLDPLAQSISLIANAGGGSSRAIIIDSAVTQAVGPAVSITTIGGGNGTDPRFNGGITIDGDINVVTSSPSQVPLLTLAGDNSGTLGDLNINATTGTAGIRLLNTSALTAGTFIINATGGLGQLYDDGSTTEKVFNGALQWGGPITSQQENMDFTGNMLLSDNLELRTGSANGRLEFSGNISDGGNGYGIDLNPDNTRSGRLVLSGTNTFTGNLKAEGGATSGTARIELNGSLSSSDITIGVRGILEGGGTIFFSDNDTIDVDGIMTATSMLFDTTSLGVTQMVLVDYAGGTFNGPGTIDDLLSPASLAAGWFLTDTGTQILAEVPVPEPSSLSLLGIGVGMMSARRRHQNQGSKRS